MAEELSLKHVTFGNATDSLTEHELIERKSLDIVSIGGFS
jgi:hypothetical protein